MWEWEIAVGAGNFGPPEPLARITDEWGAPRSRPWKLHQSREPQTEHRVRSVETSSRTDLKNLQMPTIGWRFLDTAWLASGFSIYLVAKPKTVKFPCSQGSTDCTANLDPTSGRWLQWAFFAVVFSSRPRRGKPILAPSSMLLQSDHVSFFASRFSYPLTLSPGDLFADESLVFPQVGGNQWKARRDSTT